MSVRVLFVAALLALCACAPVVQKPLQPPAGFAGPRLERDAFISFDGARLGLTVWPATGGEPEVVVVALHGMNDYAQGFWMTGPWWARRGITTYAYDQRGFGRSPERGVWGGERLMTEDLRVICALVRQRHPKAVIAVVGESMGGAVAIRAFATDRPPDADRLVLLAPAVWGWSSQPILNRAGLWIGAHVIGDRVIEPPRMFTSRIRASDNIEELRRMGRDPRMIWGTRPDTVYGLVTLMDDAPESLRKVKVPVAYLYGARDDLVPVKPTLKAAAALKPGDRTAFYERGWHILLRDLQAEVVWKDVEAFMRDPRAPFPSGAPPIPKPGWKPPKRQDAFVP
jgi:alpha-beta hydrolase superfamily lysophospholipase